MPRWALGMCYVDAEEAAGHPVWMLTGLLTYVDADFDLSLCHLPASGKNLCGPGIVSDPGVGMGLAFRGRKWLIRLKLGTPSW